MQYITALLCAGAALFLLKQIRWCLISCIGGVALSIPLLPYFTKKTSEAFTGPEYSLLSYNLNTANKKYDEVRESIGTTDADVVFLMEVNRAWIAELSPLESHYPYFTYHPRSDNFGLALYSKHPIKNDTISTFGSAGLPTIQADIHAPDHTLNLIGIHTLPPVSRVNSHHRNQTLNEIAVHIKNTPRNYQIVAGDFNCTPWSFHFKDFIAQSALKDSSIANGIGGTWFRKLGFISIPIDHVLGSAKVEFTKKEIKDTYGSDHSAILVTFRLHSDSN